MIHCWWSLLIVLGFVVSSFAPGFDDKLKISDGFSKNEHSSVMVYKTSINDLPGHILYHISSFFKNHNPYENVNQINWHCFNAFHGEFTLKQIVLNRFDIPELEVVDENEPELFIILKLSWCCNEKFFLFACLMEDLVKKTFNVLSRPLILYLNRMFSRFSFDQQMKFNFYLNTEYSTKYEEQLANICGSYGHYDLAFEYIRVFPKSMTKVFSNIDNRRSLIDFFKSNPQNAIEYGRSCLEGERLDYSCLWVAECLIFDAPEVFYTELLAFKPFILNRMVKELFHSIRIPEYEYPRIYAQMKRLFHTYMKQDLYYSTLMNEFRFSNGIQYFPNISDFNDGIISNLACAAFLGNMPDLFMNIYNSRHSIQRMIMYDISNIPGLSCHCDQATCYKYILDQFALGKEIFSNHYTNLRILLKFYALKRFKPDGNRIIFEFVTLESSLVSGFPSKISYEMISFQHIYDINYILNHIKVVDEETFSSLLTDFEQVDLFNEKDIRTSSFELLEIISKSSNLIERFESTGKKIILTPKTEDISKYFDLPNLERTSKIFRLNKYYNRDLTRLKTRKQLKAFEEMTGKSVVDIFLNIRNNIIRECDYFQWRAVFGYWIEGHEKERVKEITEPTIIDLLKLEYPNY